MRFLSEKSLKQVIIVITCLQWFYLAIFTALYGSHSQSKDGLYFPNYMYFSTYFPIFQRELSIIDFTLNYPPIRNNLTSASLLSMLIETDYRNYPPIRINLTSATHRTTGCFDDKLLTMMTDKGFYVPWRVDYNFRLAKLLEKPSGTLWWMSTLVSNARFYKNKLTLYLSQIKPHLIIISEVSREKSQIQPELSIVDFTLNYPPIRNNLTSASQLSMLIETDYRNYPPIRIDLTSATHRTTGCFDDRLLTMMTDKGFYVPWRVDYNFRLAKLLEKPSGTLWWMSTLVSNARFYKNKLTLYLSLIKPHLIIISEVSREKSQKTVISSSCASLHQRLLSALIYNKTSII